MCSASNGQEFKKTPIELVVDRSKATIGFSHYLAVFLCMGWLNFYILFMITLPFFLYFAPKILLAFVLVLAIGAFSSIDADKQPKV